MKSLGSFFVIAVTLVAAGCGHRQTAPQMTAALNAVRAMVAQGSLMAAQAACTQNAARADLIKGATALLRRATTGPEMARIHTLMANMNMQSSATGGESAVGTLTPQQRLHIAVHAAGGDAFDLLDALTRPGAPTCGQVTPVALAASAALLRQRHERGNGATTQKLDQEVDEAAKTMGDDVQPAAGSAVPDAVRELAAVLQRI